MSAEQTPDIETLAELLSWTSGEFTRYSDTAHADHNRWSWRGDGHGDRLRDQFREQAQALAPVLAAAAREAEQRALREAADALECPAYLRLGHEDSCHACMKARWLHDRAGRVAEPQHEAATGSLEYAQMVAERYGDLNDETEEETR